MEAKWVKSMFGVTGRVVAGRLHSAVCSVVPGSSLITSLLAEKWEKESQSPLPGQPGVGGPSLGSDEHSNSADLVLVHRGSPQEAELASPVGPL